MTENVHLDILSVAPLGSAERLAAIGRTLDAEPELAPEKMGPRDPPRTRITSVEAQLVAWAPTIRPGDYYNQFMIRRRPHVGGLLWITGDIWNFPPIAPHQLQLDVEESWFDEPERAARLGRFADLFRRLCESMDALWGGVELTSLRRQRNELVRAAQAAGTLVLPGLPGTGWDVREHALWDLPWLLYLGPAFVERWAGRLGGLGVRQTATANGGVVIATTADPFVLQPLAGSMLDYAWKRPFHEALPDGAIVHDRWSDPGRGVAVPSYEEHRRAAGSV
jgi:hypothetical protein